MITVFHDKWVVNIYAEGKNWLIEIPGMGQWTAEMTTDFGLIIIYFSWCRHCIWNRVRCLLIGSTRRYRLKEESLTVYDLGAGGALCWQPPLRRLSSSWTQIYVSRDSAACCTGCLSLTRADLICPEEWGLSLIHTQVSHKSIVALTFLLWP